jgi:SAM-dependent MidA family methyltransferase
MDAEGAGELERLIAEEIAESGPITFARFMELALYHPRLGYYAGGGAGREPLGWSGDYFTSGDVHPLWGWALARQLHQMWELLGRPVPFDVLEPGAGRGLLPVEVWRYALERAPEWAAALRYTLADRAPADSPLRAAREGRLSAALDALGAPPERIRWVGDPATAFATRALTGCVVSNELVDALPVHVVEARGGALREVYVGLAADGRRLVEVLGAPSSEAVASYLERFGVAWRGYPDGWRAEVCLAAEEWMRGVGTLVARGFALTLDYGDTARQLYTRDRRRGTLMVYTRHQLGERPLAQPGRQDLTAHVNFSALQAAGRAVGLRSAGLTTQAAFLTALGIQAEAEALAARRFGAAQTARQTSRGALDYLRRSSLRAAVRTLLDPYGLGGFGVLIQQRGVPGVGRRLWGLGRADAGPHASPPPPPDVGDA